MLLTQVVDFVFFVGTVFAYGVTSSGKTHTMHVIANCFASPLYLFLVFQYFSDVKSA